jgi:hypothetical protein
MRRHRRRAGLLEPRQRGLLLREVRQQEGLLLLLRLLLRRQRRGLRAHERRQLRQHGGWVDLLGVLPRHLGLRH